MEANILEGWHEFFVMTGGAAAALAGLIVVAMSVNIKKILAGPSLPSRAAATIAALMTVVVVAAISLVPDQSTTWVGGEILAASLILWVFNGAAIRRILRPGPYAGSLGQRLVKVVLALVQVIPFTVGGALILTGAEGGMAWLFVGVVTVFAGSMINAWVLLVEVLR